MAIVFPEVHYLTQINKHFCPLIFKVKLPLLLWWLSLTYTVQTVKCRIIALVELLHFELKHSREKSTLTPIILVNVTPTNCLAFCIWLLPCCLPRRFFVFSNEWTLEFSFQDGDTGIMVIGIWIFFLLWLKILQSISILIGTKAWRFLLPILIHVHYSMPFGIIVFNFRCYKHFIWADIFSSFTFVHAKSSVNSQVWHGPKIILNKLCLKNNKNEDNDYISFGRANFYTGFPNWHSRSIY